MDGRSVKRFNSRDESLTFDPGFCRGLVIRTEVPESVMLVYQESRGIFFQKTIILIIKPIKPIKPLLFQQVYNRYQKILLIFNVNVSWSSTSFREKVSNRRRSRSAFAGITCWSRKLHWRTLILQIWGWRVRRRGRRIGIYTSALSFQGGLNRDWFGNQVV